jgi:hypothetical protein
MRRDPDVYLQDILERIKIVWRRGGSGDPPRDLLFRFPVPRSRFPVPGSRL